MIRYAFNGRWLCECACGTPKVICGSHLRSGHSRSCGCFRDQSLSERRFKHGMSDGPEHIAWQRMRIRCYCKTSDNYAFYGGRGIQVCDKWRDSFEAFLADIGPKPSKTSSLDRIDSNGHYEPGNVRWAEKLVQANNTRSNRRLTFEDKTLTIAEWSRVVGLSQSTIWRRLHLGWPVEETLTSPLTNAHARRRQLQAARPNSSL